MTSRANRVEHVLESPDPNFVTQGETMPLQAIRELCLTDRMRAMQRGYTDRYLSKAVGRSWLAHYSLNCSILWGSK